MRLLPIANIARKTSVSVSCLALPMKKRVKISVKIANKLYAIYATQLRIVCVANRFVLFAQSVVVLVEVQHIAKNARPVATNVNRQHALSVLLFVPSAMKYSAPTVWMNSVAVTIVGHCVVKSVGV